MDINLHDWRDKMQQQYADLSRQVIDSQEITRQLRDQLLQTAGVIQFIDTVLREAEHGDSSEHGDTPE